MDDMRNQIDSSISALNNLMQMLDQTTAKANATIQAVAAAAAASASMGYGDLGGYGSGGGGGSGSGGSGGGGGSGGPLGHKAGQYSLVSDPYGANGTWAVADVTGKYVEISGNLSTLKKKYGLATGGYTGS